MKSGGEELAGLTPDERARSGLAMCRRAAIFFRT